MNTYTTSNQDLADVASDPEGNFVVVWQSFGQDGDRSGVFGQRYDRAGVPLGSEFQVNTYTPDYQQSPKVSVDASGNFVIAWESRGQNGDVGIFARRYDAAGAPRGDEFQVNTPTAFPQAYLGLASHPEGGFVVAWTSVAPPQVAIVGRRYDAAGQPRGDQFQINTTVNLHLLPSLAAGAGGEFVAAWQGQGKDGSDYGVIGQRFVTPVTILGELFVVRDPAPPPAGAADRRKVVVVARERRSPDPLVGDPTANGATLRVIAHGTTGSDQTFTLPAGPGWRLIGSPPIGYRYSAASGPGAVRSLLVKRTAAGTFGMKVALLGRLGPIDVVPPDVGTEGGVILTIPGGASYCVDFGGPAGGILTSAGKKLFSVKRPAAEGCPP